MAATSLASAYGPWALVAGAAEGMGRSYCERLGADGLHVLAVDRDAAGAEATCVALRSTYGVEATPVGADLATPEGTRTALLAASSCDVGLVVLNAARYEVAPFAEQGLESMMGMVDLNVRAPLVVLHGLLPHLRSRDRSAIILMSSLAATRGAPLVATYAATKAFVRELGESLWEELAPDGIDVLVVCPGSVRTPGWLASRPQAGLATAVIMEADDVVAEALGDLGSGRPSIVPGEAMREVERALAGLDRAEAIRVVGQAMREMFPPGRTPDPRL